jgi:hypothetical protein
MTMTQLFDPIEPIMNTILKKEPETPLIDRTMFMPESLIGLAQPLHDQCDEVKFDFAAYRYSCHLQNNISDLILSPPAIKQSFDERSQSPTNPSTANNKENIPNEALLQSPNEQEELLYACSMCRNYWLSLPEELRHKQGLHCRHRKRPLVQSPEHFWSLGIPNTQTCIQRGYGGVLPPNKPIERPRRPRRQQQRLFKAEDQPIDMKNPNDSDDSDELF